MEANSTDRIVNTSILETPQKHKKVWEELTTYFPFTVEYLIQLERKL
jgi:hypothetical protein